MKTRRSNQKLVLNKATLVNLRWEELANIRGGSFKESCTSDSDVDESFLPKACDEGRITGAICQ